MVAQDVRKVIEEFRSRKQPFGETVRSERIAKAQEEIAASPVASWLLSEGYPMAFAHRAAQLERERNRDRLPRDLMETERNMATRMEQGFQESFQDTGEEADAREDV